MEEKDLNSIRDSSKTLVEIVQTKLGNIFAKSVELYFAYLVCANTVDVLGMNFYSLAPEDLCSVCESNPDKYQVTIEGKTTKVVPTISQWRNFLSERQVTEWLNYRFYELMKSVKAKYINKIANGLPLTTQENSAMGQVTKIEKQMEKDTRDTNSAIIEMFCAPLEFGKPNSNQIETDTDDKVDSEKLKDTLAEAFGGNNE